MDLGLAGKNAIITGASGGIGGAIARLFVAEKVNTVLHFNRGKERAETIQADLSAQYPESKTAVIGADLTVETEVASLFEESERQLGPTNILIANAGAWPKENVTLDKLSTERWRQTIDTNLTSVFFCVRQFLQRCEAANITDPSIVMIGSTAGHFGEADHGDYATAKSGLMGGLLQTLKNEIPKTFPLGRINAVCPGWTMTPLARKFASDKEAMTKALQTIPMKKFASSEDIAKSVLFFASNVFSGHVTGQTLFVSGGMEGRVLNQPDEIDLGKAF